MMNTEIGDSALEIKRSQKIMTPAVNKGAARYGPYRQQFDRNRKKIIASQSVCGICGLPVDKRLKYPNPMSATVDHIIPIDKGGHPFDLDNLQLAHWCCNRQKSDKLYKEQPKKEQKISNRVLPQSLDWATYSAE